MIKTADELKQQAIRHDIRRWNIHHCSICGYPCGYVFSDDKEMVAYDSGCYCVQYGVQYATPERSWSDIAISYNQNQPENNPKISKQYLDEVNAVWQFDEYQGSPAE